MNTSPPSTPLPISISNPRWNNIKVSLGILFTASVIFGCGWFGHTRNYAGDDSPAPLYRDQGILENAEYTILPYLGIFAISLVLGIGLNGKFWPKLCNTIAFALLVGGAFFWTQHTGGLSRGLYGAGYLSLFAVAIVPTTRWVKWATVFPVAAGVIILMNAVPPAELRRERYYGLLCLLGAGLATLMRWSLRE